MSNFVEMYFDLKFSVNIKLQQTLVQMLGEVDRE